MEKKVQKRTIESRKKFLNAAYSAFTEKGFYSVNLKDISERAGVSVGNFYNYFNDKEEIYCVLAEEYLEGSYNQMVDFVNHINQIDNEEDGKKYIFSFFGNLTIRASNTNLFFKDTDYLANNSARLHDALYGTEGKLMPLLQGFFEKRYPKDKYKCYDFKVIARMVYVIVNNLGNDMVKFRDEDNRKAYLQHMCQLVYNICYHIENCF